MGAIELRDWTIEEAGGDDVVANESVCMEVDAGTMNVGNAGAVARKPRPASKLPTLVGSKAVAKPAALVV